MKKIAILGFLASISMTGVFASENIDCQVQEGAQVGQSEEMVAKGKPTKAPEGTSVSHYDATKTVGAPSSDDQP